MTLFYFDVTDGRETSRDILENDVGTVEITIREQDHGPALFSVVWASVAEARENKVARERHAPLSNVVSPTVQGKSDVPFGPEADSPTTTRTHGARCP